MSSNTQVEARTTPRIFISHSHEDHDFCVRLVGDLRARFGEGAVWYDASGGQHGLTGGEAWWDEIVAEITARPYFLVVLSPHAVASRWVPQEMGIAFRQHVELDKRLLPVRLADAPRRADWAGIQEFYFEESRPYEEALAELIQAIDPLRQAQRPSPASAQPVAAPLSPQQALLQRLEQEVHTAYGRERWTEVKHRTDALITRKAMTPTLWRERASAALALGDVTAANQAIHEALSADADDIATVLLQARILLRQGHAEQAAEALTQADTLAPMDDAVTRLPLLADLCDALAQAGQWDTLLARCGDALYLAPNDATWLRRQRDALLKLNRADEALIVANTVVASLHPTVDDFLIVARLLKRQGAGPAVIRSVLRAADIHANASEGLRVIQAESELLPPPPPAIPEARFPARLATLGFQAHAGLGAEWITPPLVSVAAGRFLMGSDPARDEVARANDWAKREMPQDWVEVAEFQIAKYPVTAAEYALAVNARAVREPPAFGSVTWQTQLQRLDHPVVCVSWQDAIAYITWLRTVTREPGWRLPSEAQWEKAARWDARANASHIYPWGDSFDKARCNTSESGIGATAPVGSYPASDAQCSGASPCGAEEMAGNVWEWTSSLYKPYKYSESDGREGQNTTGNRALRGGSWFYVAEGARAAFRIDFHPAGIFNYVGFRLGLSRVSAGAAGD